MKKIRIALVILLAAVLWLVWSRMDRSRVEAADPVPISWQGSPPTAIQTDTDEIFKKAFWRRPSEADGILHAERHEWSGADGLERWQWFLVVKPSDGLIRYLRDDNAFGLVPASTAVRVSEAPDWFRFAPEEVSTLQSPHGGMRLMFSKTGNRLYATASGRGFTKGVPEPPPAEQGAPVPGRIPTTPPPLPTTIR